MAPYKNFGRFYRVTFKSLLRLQIKLVSIFSQEQISSLSQSTLSSKEKGGGTLMHSKPDKTVKFYVNNPMWICLIKRRDQKRKGVICITSVVKYQYWVQDIKIFLPKSYQVKQQFGVFFQMENVEVTKMAKFKFSRLN